MMTLRTFLVLAAAVLAAAPAAGQTPGDPATLTVQAGAFRYSREGQGLFPMAAVRYDWPVTRFVRFEVGGALARPAADVALDQYETPTTVRVHTHLFSATGGIQLQLPTERISPYIGIASGFFARRDPSPGEHFVGRSQEVMGGVRIPVTAMVGLRAEYRARFDEDAEGRTSRNQERTLGLTVRL